jgi:hypothetical protein
VDPHHLPPATAARSSAGTRPSRCPKPRAYRPLVHHPRQPVRRAQHQHRHQQQAVHRHHQAGYIPPSHSALRFTTAPAKMIINPACTPTHCTRRHATHRTLHQLGLAMLAPQLHPSLLRAHASRPQSPAARQARRQYAAFDAHPNEHVTIAADPCDDPKQCPFFRLPYIQHGLLPVRVIFTNDSDRALSLDDARMQFISANNDKIPAATEDDINRRLFTIRSAEGTKIPSSPSPSTTARRQKDHPGRQRLRLPLHHRQRPLHPRRLPLLRHQGPRRPRPRPRRTLRQDGPHPRRQAGTLRLLHPLRQMARRQPRRAFQPPATVVQLLVASCPLRRTESFPDDGR